MPYKIKFVPVEIHWAESYLPAEIDEWLSNNRIRISKKIETENGFHVGRCIATGDIPDDVIYTLAELPEAVQVKVAVFKKPMTNRIRRPKPIHQMHDFCDAECQAFQ